MLIQLEPSPEISIHIRCHLHDIIVIHHDRLYEIVQTACARLGYRLVRAFERYVDGGYHEMRRQAMEEEARRQVGCLVGVQIDGHLRPESDMKQKHLV